MKSSNNNRFDDDEEHIEQYESITRNVIELIVNFTANLNITGEKLIRLTPIGGGSHSNNSIYENESLENNNGNATNSTYEAQQLPEYIRYSSVVFCTIIMILGFLGNVMVPIVILKTKDMRNSTNIFLVNLSIADLMVLMVCTPTVLVEVNSAPDIWILGREMCKIVPFVELTVAHASVLTILAISFERYYAICEPLKAGYVCTKARALLICVICWLCAALLTSPILEIATYQMEEYFDGSYVPVCWTVADSFWRSFFFIFSISAFFILPFFILIILYSIIAKHLMLNPSLISAQNSRNNFLKYRKQVIGMLAAVVFSFFVCLLPFRAFTLWIILSPSETIVEFLMTPKGLEIYQCVLYFSRCLIYLNSAINPILYNLMSSKFRDGFFRLFGCRQLIKKANWSESARKGTFHTTSTNLSSSNNNSAYSKQRSKNFNRAISDDSERGRIKNDAELDVAKSTCIQLKLQNDRLMKFIDEDDNDDGGDQDDEKNCSIINFAKKESLV